MTPSMMAVSVLASGAVYLYDVFVGCDEERPYTLSGDRLTLTPVWSQDGRQWTGRRVFERIK